MATTGGCLLPTGAASAAAFPPPVSVAARGAALLRVSRWGRQGRVAGERAAFVGPWGGGPFARSPPPPPGAHAHRGRGCCRRSSPSAAAATPWARRRRRRTAAGSRPALRSRRARLLAGLCGRQRSFLLVARPPSHGGRWPESTLPRAATAVATRSCLVLVGADLRGLAPMFFFFRVTWSPGGRTPRALTRFVIIP